MPVSEEEIIVCYSCQAPMNVAEVAPYSRVICPACNAENRVKKQFGPYTLSRRHAIGGMSSVFIAIDEALDREVVLKILSEEFSKDEKRIAAFEEEARLTASFSHPNVVRVLTTGKAFGRLYIAMEFVPGGHFEQKIREKGQIPETEVLPFAIQVAEGLKGAQAAGLIHRDVKPGNILLDAGGNVKIVDFGLALVTKQGKATATEIWATPYYVPPETIEGGAEDFRSDIYAFGATLYHALAGKPPCDEESMATDVLREAKKKIVPLKKVAPHLLDETCAVVDRAMAYDPENRFSSYDEMIDELKTALKIANGEAVVDSGGMSKAEHRAELRSLKRRKNILVGCGVAFAAIAAIALVFLFRSSPSEPEIAAPKVVSVDPADENPMESPAEIAAKYGTAREAMERGDYSSANSAFSELLADHAVQEPTRTWAGLEAVAASLMDGRMERARQDAATAVNHISSGPAGLDVGFSIAVQPILENFSKFDFFNFAKVAPAIQGNERFMGLFLAGLKNWESGGIQQAVPFLEAVATEPTLASDGVLSWYQEAAKTYLADYRLLNSGGMDAEPKSLEECSETIEELNTTLTLLKTNGRARFNVRSRLLDLARLRKSLKKTVPVPTSPPVVDLMGEIEALAKKYQFVELVSRITALKSDPPGMKRDALLLISQAALVFLTEIENSLQTNPATITLTTRDGTEITSIARTAEGKLVGKLSSDEIRDLAWGDFSTAELIALHRELGKKAVSEMERLRRHETAIAFEWCAGDRARALKAAARLSDESEVFKDRWESIASGLPK